ncbi:PQ-loop repeat-containing protein 1-like [Planoprotostelium fungivorum]|uniref:Solute carrier family 66 member 2 n=1 Tax=Planoprotostelium fungivorum TaxID=1890364 RepID=A0A2P6N2D2_9EUKA|nr:PQ-loop repeat-containing protein 1-like [Planoprotostelium fungivorum]PRP79184.1 PQ-loop repeat-containing protein 1-like [Planoprotostelium fungivorum]
MEIFGYIFDAIMVFAPVLGYIPQYKSFEKKQSSEGFSTRVSLILLVSNILRCIFRIGKPFENTLLFQSIVMIIAQLVMLEACVRLSPTSAAARRRTILQDPTSVKDFWNWTDYNSYLFFLGAFTFAILLVSGIFASPVYWEVLGTVALLTESCLGVPQALDNHRNGSTAGLSWALIGSWLGGDLFKTIYFIATGAPFQFLACGVIQIVVDFIIVAQIYASEGAQRK